MLDHFMRYRENRNSIYLQLFGRSPQTRILDLFLDNPGFEFSRPELIRELGMAKVTLYDVFPAIIQSEFVVKTRKVGNAELFKLNSKSENIKDLRSIIRRYSTLLSNLEPETPEDESFFAEGDEEKRILLAND